MNARAVPLRPAGRVALVGLLGFGAAVGSGDLINLLVFFAPYAVVGALLVARRPRNPVSWLVLAIGFGFIPTSPPQDLDLAALEAGTASTRDFLLAWLATWGGGVGFLGHLALSLVFPTGRLPGGRWHGPAIALIAVEVGLLLLSATAPTLSFNPDLRPTPIVVPNRLAVLPDLPLWSLRPSADAISLLVILVLPAIGAGSMFVRLRHATGIERLQLRWLAAAIAFVVAGLAIGLGTFAISGDSFGGLGWIPAIVAYPCVPLAIGIAILRYRLYEIDRIISRTVGYLMVTALLVGVFAVVVVGLQALLASFTNSQGIPVAVSTLVVFALFQPLRRRVQSSIDRRFHRARYDAEQTQAAFAARLRHNVDLESLSTEIRDVLRATIAPASVGVWLRSEQPGSRR